MKKILVYFIILAIGFGLGAGALLLISGKNEVPDTIKETESITTGIFSSTDLELTEYNNKQLLDFAYDALSYIRMSDYVSLSSIVHPEYGLVFSPYSTVNLSSNKCFSRNQVSGFASDTTDYVWGVKNESGEPIELTPAEYFAQYVYVYDYSKADIIGVNQIARSGNALENVKEVFPEAYYIDFCILGSNQNSSEGIISWSILRLVFEEYKDDLMLTAVIHSEYTS